MLTNPTGRTTNFLALLKSRTSQYKNAILFALLASGLSDLLKTNKGVTDVRITKVPPVHAIDIQLAHTRSKWNKRIPRKKKPKKNIPNHNIRAKQKEFKDFMQEADEHLNPGKG